MSISEILTQIEVTPGLPGPMADPALRSPGKTAPNSDYREKLARNLNDIARPENPPQEKPAAAGSSAAEAPPPRENPARSAASASRSSIRKNPPKQSTEVTSAEKSSEFAQAAAETPEDSSPQAQADSLTTAAGTLRQDDIATDGSFEAEAPSAEEISNTALALLAINFTTVPALPAYDLEEPEAPVGLYQLLEALPAIAPLDPQFSQADDLESGLLPPAGLLEAFNIPGISAPEEISGNSVPESVTPLAASSDVSQAVSENVTTVYSSQTPNGYEVVSITPTADVAPVIPGNLEETADQLPVISLSSTAGRVSKSDDLNPTPGQDSETTDLNSSTDTSEHNFRTEETAVAGIALHSQAAAASADPSQLETPIHESSARRLADASSPLLPASETQNSAVANAEAADENRDFQVSTKPLESIDDNSSTLQDSGPLQGTSSDSNDDVPTNSSGLNPLSTAPRSEIVPALYRSQHADSLTAARVDANELVERVSGAMGAASQAGRALRIRLHPPELGVLQIEIISKDGMLTARLETQTAAAHQTILESISSLKEALAHAGSPIERIEVQVAENRGSDSLARHSDEQNDGSQQQNSQQQQRGDDTQDDARQEDDAPAIRRVSGNALDQLDIQI